MSGTTVKEDRLLVGVCKGGGEELQISESAETVGRLYRCVCVRGGHRAKPWIQNGVRWPFFNISPIMEHSASQRAFSRVQCHFPVTDIPSSNLEFLSGSIEGK